MTGKFQKIFAVAAVCTVVTGFVFVVSRAGFPSNAAVAVGGDNGSVKLKLFTNEICVPEEQDITLSGGLADKSYAAKVMIQGSPTQLGEKFYITEIETSEAISLDSLSKSFEIKVENGNYAGYPGSPTTTAPGDEKIVPTIRFRSPTVSAEKGEEMFVSSFKATAREYKGVSGWGTESPNDMMIAETERGSGITLKVQHRNRAPYIQAASNQVQDNSNGTYQLRLTSLVQDAEGNELTLFFEISTDNFISTYAQQTYDVKDLAVGSQKTVEHTFENLPAGTYQWRVRAEETGKGIKATCEGGKYEIKATPLTSNHVTEIVTLGGEVAGQTTPISVQTTKNKTTKGGNLYCKDVGDYMYTSGRINYNNGKFDASFPEGLAVSTDGTYVNWVSTFGIGAVIVKGGPSANVYTYDPYAYADSGLHSPVNASGKPAGLSNITFCWNDTPSIPPVPEPEPDPTPEPVPEPEPDPLPDPTPEPVPDPTPDPLPDPTPEPVPDPTPEPEPDPIPEPVPEPTPEPDPIPEPDPEVIGETDQLSDDVVSPPTQATLGTSTSVGEVLSATLSNTGINLLPYIGGVIVATTLAGVYLIRKRTKITKQPVNTQ